MNCFLSGNGSLKLSRDAMDHLRGISQGEVFREKAIVLNAVGNRDPQNQILHCAQNDETSGTGKPVGRTDREKAATFSRVAR